MKAGRVVSLTEFCASDLSRMIAARQVAPSEITMASLDRIDAVNGPINAVISLRDREARMAEMRQADDAERSGWHNRPCLPAAGVDFRRSGIGSGAD